MTIQALSQTEIQTVAGGLTLIVADNTVAVGSLSLLPFGLGGVIDSLPLSTTVATATGLVDQLTASLGLTPATALVGGLLGTVTGLVKLA